MRGRLATMAAAALALGVFTVYALAMATLFAVRAGVTMALPWWVALLAPAVWYGLLAAVGLPRMSAGSRVTGFAALCVVHVIVAAVTAVLVAWVADMSVAIALEAASLSFMPAPLLQLLAVPVMLLPLRALLTRRPRAQRARRPEVEPDWSRPRTETLPGWQVGRPVGTNPVSTGAAASPARAAGASPAAEPAAVFSVPGSAAPLYPSPPAQSTPPPTLEPVPSVAAPPAPSAAPLPSPAARPAPLAEPLTVAARPSAVAAEPPLLAPSLTSPDPGAIAPAAVVPPPVVATAAAPPETARELPRVPEEDTVAIPFARIATVLPADLLACDVARLSADLAAPGFLLVPVAMVVPQLADGFVAVEWEAVKDQFPAAAFRVALSDVGQRLPEGRVPLPLDEVVRRLPPETFAMATPQADLGTLESFPPPFQPVETAPPLPEPPAPVAIAEPSVDREAEAPRSEPGVAVLDSAAGLAAPAAASEAPGDGHRDPAEEEPAEGEPRLAHLARALAPVGSLSGSVANLDGKGVYLFRPPSLGPEAVLSSMSPALDMLRGPSAPLQLTVRLERGAVVLTPLAAPSGATALVVAASPLDGSLALLEILSLRCGASAAAPAGEAADRDGALEPVAGGPAADLIAGALTSFGTFAPSVIRDPDGRAELCLLHAPGEATRELATVAHAVCCALASMDSGALGPVQSAALRLAAGPDGAARRIALRPVAGRAGHWIALAAPAGDARPGLVELEITRAAARAAR